MGTTVPYGYLKNPEYKGNQKEAPWLIIDPEAAPIVKRIFDMNASGLSPYAICRTFEQEQILCPSVYLFRKTGSKSGTPSFDRPYHWSERTVRKMLSNQFYCGDTVNFKTYTKSNKLKKRIRNDSSRILIFRDTHEPIVERSVFDAVQKHFEGRKRPDRTGELDMLAGYLYCGDCGKRMYLHRTYKKKAGNNFYQCGGYQSHTTDCSIHYIRQNVIEEIILSNLRRLTSFARSEPEQFYEMALKRGKTEAAKIQKSAVKQQADIEVRLKQLDSIIRCLYEDRVVGRITPERYDEMVVGYEKEMAELKQKQTELKNNLSLYSQQQHAIQDFIDKAKAYAEMPKLTVELLHTFIQRVDVYKKIDKNSRKTENPIMIYYKFQITKPEQLAVMFGLEEDDFSKADNPEPAELDFTA